MRLSGFVWMPYSDSHDDYRALIAKAAIEENWGQDYKYLQDYIRDNFEISFKQKIIKEDAKKRYVIWRVGKLTTREGEPITILATKNRLTGKEPYVFKTIFTRQHFPVKIDNDEIHEEAPPAPSYETPQYQPEFKLVYNFDHYLEDHEQRAEEKFPKLNQHQRFLCIYAALRLAIKDIYNQLCRNGIVIKMQMKAAINGCCLYI